jgi:hypothetical protein
MMMKICRIRFNIYLLLAMLGLAGCETGSPGDGKSPEPGSTQKINRKEASTLRFHYTINNDGTDRCLPITVYRAHPMNFYIDRTPFLWEANVVKATVTSNMGTYGLRIEFDRQGAMALQSFTSEHKSRHLAIYSDFGQSRWLAAPIITRIISNGVFDFTPDATLEETHRIARGLNNLYLKNEGYFDRRDRKAKEKQEKAALKP